MDNQKEGDFSGENIINQQLGKEFWNNKWVWDIGHASPPITAYMDKYPNKDARILIPGCGNAHEAEYLMANGFTNVTLLDVAPKAVEKLRKKYEQTLEIEIINKDFFKHDGKYDLIIEQTFFCAIEPSFRTEYAQKAHELLESSGLLMGVLFSKPFEKAGPPFGGTLEEYEQIFAPHFEIEKMEECYNSISPRLGSELFIILKKKQNEKIN